MKLLFHVVGKTDSLSWEKEEGKQQPDLGDVS